MITGMIIKIVILLFSVIGAIIPAWKLPNYIIDPVNEVAGFFNLLNGYLPMTAFLKVLILIIGFEITIMTAKVVLGILSLIRGGGKVDID